MRGLIKIYAIEENSAIDVANEIIGKKNYTTADGVALSNGMKINFAGTVTPSQYAEKDYFVENYKVSEYKRATKKYEKMMFFPEIDAKSSAHHCARALEDVINRKSDRF